MPPLQDDDVLLVGRGGNNYKITWAELKSEIQALPFNNNDLQTTSEESQEEGL